MNVDKQEKYWQYAERGRRGKDGGKDKGIVD